MVFDVDISQGAALFYVWCEGGVIHPGCLVAMRFNGRGTISASKSRQIQLCERPQVIGTADSIDRSRYQRKRGRLERRPPYGDFSLNERGLLTASPRVMRPRF